MRVEIVRELDPDDDKLEVPWASLTDPGLQYVDLKAAPDKAEQLEECRRFPPLTTLLRLINRAGSLFRSAKCGVWKTTELTEDERVDFGLPYKVGSYVDVLFDNAKFNSRLEYHLQFGEKLKQALRNARGKAQIEVCVRRCLFHPEERWGYYLTIFTHAYGADAAEAEGEWRRAVGALGEGLGQVDEILRGVLANLGE